MRRTILILSAAVVVFFVGMQFNRPNIDRTPVNPQASFESQVHADGQIHATLRQSCYSCHSAETKIPWYGQVWPASALIENDIRDGRAHLDFSSWGNLSPEMARNRLVKACESMREGEMPLWYYRPMHPGSVPSAHEIESFCTWVHSSSTVLGRAEAE